MAQATAERTTRPPEYTGASGSKTSTDMHPATETATEARQGVTGQGVRYVLIFGIAGVVIAFAVIYAVFLT
jgi:cobalamin biosynthesis Mg chelatase CobN